MVGLCLVAGLYDPPLPNTCGQSRQKQNLDDCFNKLKKMIIRAAKPPKVRKMRTEPSQFSKDKRVESKRRRSEVKRARRKPRSMDDLYYD